MEDPDEILSLEELSVVSSESGITDQSCDIGMLYPATPLKQHDANI